MGLSGWVLALIDAVSAALLLNGGIAKLLSPAQPARAAAEIAPAVSGGMLPGVIRGFAAAEIAVALGLLVAPALRTAAVAALVLGICFIALGVLGRIRSTTSACGCFGESGRRPLGWINVGCGLVLCLAFSLSVLLRRPAGGYTADAVVLAAACAMLLCLWLNRRVAVGALISARANARARTERRPAAPAGSGVR